MHAWTMLQPIEGGKLSSGMIAKADPNIQRGTFAVIISELGTKYAGVKADDTQL